MSNKITYSKLRLWRSLKVSTGTQEILFLFKSLKRNSEINYDICILYNQNDIYNKTCFIQNAPILFHLNIFNNTYLIIFNYNYLKFKAMVVPN